jgi:hypothetical protein
MEAAILFVLSVEPLATTMTSVWGCTREACQITLRIVFLSFFTGITTDTKGSGELAMGRMMLRNGFFLFLR